MSKSLNLIEQLVYHKKEIDESYNHLQKLTSQMNRLISVKTLMNDSYKTLDKVANLKEEVPKGDAKGRTIEK